MTIQFPVFVTTVASVLLTAVHAQTPEPNNAAPIRSERTSPTSRTRFDVSLSASYTAPGDAKFGGVKHDESDASVINLAIRASQNLNSTWAWTAAARSENIFLDEIPGLPIPDHVHTLGLNTGPTYRLNEQWTFGGTIGALLYRFEDIDTDTFGLTTTAYALWRQNENLLWNFGFSFNPDSDLKVFPAIGVRWLINPDWTLDLGIPRTRLTYKLNRAWQLHTGLDMVGTTFRASETFDTAAAITGYNNALATYRDLRLGAGASVTVHRAITLDLEAGASIYRRLDYTRLDRELRFTPSPFLRAAATARF